MVCRTAGQFAQFEDELFLQVVGEVILGAEEDDAAFGDCNVLERSSILFGVWHT